MNYRISGKYGKTAPRTGKGSRSGDARTITTDLLLWGSLKSLTTTMANLERAEIRRMRVECVVNLAGLRFILGEARPGQTPIPADAEIVKLMFELNRIAMLWADDAEVLKSVRDFHAEPTNKERLFAIIRNTAKTTSLHASNLADSDIGSVFQLTRPAGQPSPGTGPR